MKKATSHLVLMLLLTSAVFVFGAAQKAPCATAKYAQTSLGPRFSCYSDLSVLLEFEQLAGGRVPYLDACAPAVRPCDEYPVLSMMTMYVAAQISGGRFLGFYLVNVGFMLLCALVITWTLERTGARTLLFAAAPALALYGSLNWDLFAVAAATVATALLLRRRDVLTGISLGIGAAAKLYPALLVIPFALQRATEGRRRGALTIAVTAGSTWLLINGPFAIAGTQGWLEVFRFNRDRGADFESMWTVLCGLGLCFSARTLNVVIPVLVVVGTWLIWRRVVAREPTEPRWLLGFPLLVMVVVLGKFWSPQYALWLLPWFAFSRIPLRAWFAYQLTEVLEFMARSAFMTDVPGTDVSQTTLNLAVALRALFLLRALWFWMRDPQPTPGMLGAATGSVVPTVA